MQEKNDEVLERDEGGEVVVDNEEFKRLYAESEEICKHSYLPIMHDGKDGIVWCCKCGTACTVDSDNNIKTVRFPMFLGDELNIRRNKNNERTVEK